MGPDHSGLTDKAGGNMIFSPNGTKLAYILHDNETRINIDLYDFDQKSGFISNRYNIPITITNTDGYGVCFSPNSNVLYATYFLEGKIVQYDLLANDIAASGLILNNAIDSKGFGKPKLGPNGKIYVPRFSSNYISTITNPNIVGVGANYIKEGINLGISGTVSPGTPEMFFSSNKPIKINSILSENSTCVPNGSMKLFKVVLVK